MLGYSCTLFFQVDCLPKYGPYTASEDEIHLFDSIKDKKVLDIGCGSGHSLQYMAEHGAEELWGLDFSRTQIETAHETLQSWNPKLICGAMEEEGDIPKGYFDIVYSIYALGWTSDLRKTLELIYSYVKPGEVLFLVGSTRYIQTYSMVRKKLL